MVDEAIGFHERFQRRYWDALILAAAKLSGCLTVVSEDLNDRQNYDGVAVVNPFNVPA
jgi:predicted nucleic acid-binding protein